jgi:hypothetical protein
VPIPLQCLNQSERSLFFLGAWLVACELHGLGVSWAPSGPEKWLHLPMMAVGATLCIARGIARPRERAAWILIGLGVLAWTLGELYFTVVLWSDESCCSAGRACARSHGWCSSTA